MLEHLAIIVLMIEISLLVLFSLYLYRNIFNPLSIFACVNVGLFTVGSYFNTTLLQLDYIDFSISSLNHAVWISTIWLASFSIGFFPIPKWIYHKYSFPVNFPSYKGRGNIPYYILLASLGLISFIALCVYSDSLKWLTNPREAYLYLRVGVGHFYIGFVWFSLMLFSTILFFKRPKFWGLVFWLSFFLFVLYFSGKKSVIISLFAISCVYFHFYIKNFSLFISTIIIIIILSAILFLISYNSNLSIISTLSYFDYIRILTRSWKKVRSKMAIISKF